MQLTRRSRKPGHTTSAAKAEDRQSLHGRRQTEAIGKYGIKAWHGKTGCRDSDNGFNVAQSNACPVGALSRHIFEKLNGGRSKNIGT